MHSCTGSQLCNCALCTVAQSWELWCYCRISSLLFLQPCSDYVVVSLCPILVVLRTERWRSQYVQWQDPARCFWRPPWLEFSLSGSVSARLVYHYCSAFPINHFHHKFAQVCSQMPDASAASYQVNFDNQSVSWTWLPNFRLLSRSSTLLHQKLARRSWICLQILFSS